MDVTANHTVYRFPILKNAEIIECLSEAGIELNESELTEPLRHKEKVKQVFLSLVSLTVIHVISRAPLFVIDSLVGLVSHPLQNNIDRWN